MGLLSSRTFRQIALGAAGRYEEKRQTMRDRIDEYRERALTQKEKIQEKYNEFYDEEKQNVNNFKGTYKGEKSSLAKLIELTSKIENIERIRYTTSHPHEFKDDLVGFFELIFHPEKNETEIAYFGILEEYQNKKLGSYLLSEAIKKSFENKVNRVWVHTCSLDHKNALSNYISRGMKIFKTEILNI